MKLRNVIIPSALVGIAGLAILAFRPRPIQVDVGTIHRGPLQVTIDVEGKTRVRERHVVSSPLAGTLLRPRLRAGDCVGANTVLAQLRPVAPPLLDVRTRAEVEARARSAADTTRQAEASLARARSASELARREMSRARALATIGSISKDALERAEFEATARAREVEVAEHALAVARHDREVAQAALLQTRGLGQASTSEQWDITSPVTATVLRVLQENEAVVQPGTPLFELGDLGSLELIAEVLTTDAVAVHPGAPVVVERWGGPNPLRARVRRIEPSAFTKVSALGVEEQRVNVLADFEDPPNEPRDLGDGYRVELRIVVADIPDALLVSVSAAFRRGAAWAVFVLANGRAHLRELELGRRNENDAEVLGHASAGERVVLYPGEALRDGARAEPR